MAITVSTILRKFRNRMVRISSPLPQQIIYLTVKLILAGLSMYFLSSAILVDFADQGLVTTPFLRTCALHSLGSSTSGLCRDHASSRSYDACGASCWETAMAVGPRSADNW